MRARLLLPLLLLLLCSVPLAAQRPPDEGSDASSRIRAGVLPGLSISFPSSRFSVKQSSDSCGFYEAAPFLSGGLALFADYLPARSRWWLGLRFDLRSRSFTPTSPPRTFETRSGGEISSVTKQFEVGLTRRELRVGAAGGYAPLEWMRLGLVPWLSFTSGEELGHTERIVEPEGAIFEETGVATRPLDGGRSLEFAPLVAGVDLMGAVELPLGDLIAIRPELRASFPFTSLLREVTWREPEVTAAVGISLLLARWGDETGGAPTGPVAVGDPEPPLRTPMPVLRASLRAYGVDARGERYADPVIEIEETPWTEHVPLLPYVFFDSASALVPLRYARLAPVSTPSFDPDSLLDVSPLTLHHQTLNLIGRCLTDQPELDLEIIGEATADEGAGPEETQALALRRAAAVVAYLVEVWRIDSSRLSGAALVREPSSPSSPDISYPAEAAELRRVRFRTRRGGLLAPITIERLATVASPPSVVFEPAFVADTTIADWYISVLQGERELLRFEGNADREGGGPRRRSWSLADLRVTRDLTPVRYRLVVRDVLGQSATAEGSFRVVEREARRQRDSLGRRTAIMEHGLIGFTYADADLPEGSEAEISALAAAIPTNATISLVGHTDRVGDAERNRLLSLERAQRVLDSLRQARRRRGLPDLIVTSVTGLGGEGELFDATLPEGRILSRTVRVTVTAPIP